MNNFIFNCTLDLQTSHQNFEGKKKQGDTCMDNWTPKNALRRSRIKVILLENSYSLFS